MMTSCIYIYKKKKICNNTEPFKIHNGGQHKTFSYKKKKIIIIISKMFEVLKKKKKKKNFKENTQTKVLTTAKTP